jgi:hypothetical protein
MNRIGGLVINRRSFSLLLLLRFWSACFIMRATSLSAHTLPWRPLSASVVPYWSISDHIGPSRMIIPPPSLDLGGRWAAPVCQGYSGGENIYICVYMYVYVYIYTYDIGNACSGTLSPFPPSPSHCDRPMHSMMSSCSGWKSSCSGWQCSCSWRVFSPFHEVKIS